MDGTEWTRRKLVKVKIRESKRVWVPGPCVNFVYTARTLALLWVGPGAFKGFPQRTDRVQLTFQLDHLDCYVENRALVEAQRFHLGIYSHNLDDERWWWLKAGGSSGHGKKCSDCTDILRVETTVLAFFRICLGPHCDALTSQPDCKCLVGKAQVLCVPSGSSSLGPSILQRAGAAFTTHPWSFNKKELTTSRDSPVSSKCDSRALAILSQWPTMWENVSWDSSNLYPLPKTLQHIMSLL